SAYGKSSKVQISADRLCFFNGGEPVSICIESKADASLDAPVIKIFDSRKKLIKSIPVDDITKCAVWNGTDSKGKKVKSNEKFIIYLAYGKKQKSNTIIIRSSGEDKKDREMDAFDHDSFASGSELKEKLYAEEEACPGLPDTKGGMKYKSSGGRRGGRKDYGSSGSTRMHKISHRYSRGSVGGLRAGFADDNKQFNYFISFLEKYKSMPHIDIDISERILIKLKDEKGMTIPDAKITVYKGTRTMSKGMTYADGSFMIFPDEFDAKGNTYRVKANVNGRTFEWKIDRKGERIIEKKLSYKRPAVKKVPMDLLFVLDTTGSMGEEIERLKRTIEIININLNETTKLVDLKIGLVLFRDKGDAYVTHTIPLTSDIDKLEANIAKIHAGGGGDTPEDLESALDVAVNEIEWRKKGIKLAYIITDAPPHLNYKRNFNYYSSAKKAKTRGIKVHSIGTGGLNTAGEYVLRQISQYTSGRYIFLHYGERGESDGGKVGSVSHHTGENYTTDKLESIIIKFSKEEIMDYTGKSEEEVDEYFKAEYKDSEDSKEVISDLFKQAVKQLIDYSTYKIKEKAKLAVIPMEVKNDDVKSDGEYFMERLVLTLKDNERFTLIDRENLQKILEELSIQHSGVCREGDAEKIGELLGAEYLLTSSLYLDKDQYRIFLRLVKVETGEIVSATKCFIERELGIIN
ncbi:VWA domain-containing protein, partial [Spirochaetota bacterium]